jgi:hypothetical protein
VSKWARTYAADKGRRAIAAISHRSWTPAVVTGGTTSFAGAAAAAGSPGADTAGEPHAPVSTTTVATSAIRNGHAERPGLRSLEPSFMISPLLAAGHGMKAAVARVEAGAFPGI